MTDIEKALAKAAEIYCLNELGHGGCECPEGQCCDPIVRERSANVVLAFLQNMPEDRIYRHGDYMVSEAWTLEALAAAVERET
jgi:hypothetical protein